MDNTSNELQIIVWQANYDTGIAVIDAQHRELGDLINELYRACRSGGDDVGVAFKDAMGRMVEYVKKHFKFEHDLMQRIHYPGYHEHVREHEKLIKEILDAAKDFNEGKRFVPHNFVRLLRDWILSHIAVVDREYVMYIHDQKKKGLLHDMGL